MSDDQSRKARWRAEFEALGNAKLRGEVMLGRFPPDKRAYARQWLEQQDIAQWQARSPGGGLAKLRVNRKLWGLVGGLVFGGLVVYRVLRQLKAGF
jgi:hypothetical protein